MKAQNNKRMQDMNTALLIFSILAIVFITFLILIIVRVSEESQFCQEENEIEWQDFEAQESPLIGVGDDSIFYYDVVFGCSENTSVLFDYGEISLSTNMKFVCDKILGDKK